MKTKTKIPRSQCDDCGWTGPDTKIKVALGEVPYLYERLDPGSIVPSGECPKCGSLCYPVVRPNLTQNIHALLDGVEWSPSTLDEIATLLRRNGYPVRDTSETWRRVARRIFKP